MNSTLARTVVSFALVAAAYWTYTTVAEPLLAGSATDSNQPPPNSSLLLGRGADAGRPAGKQLTAAIPAPTERFQRLIAPLFPEGSWERTNARVIKNDQFILLSSDFETLETGQLHVFPCTIVFQPKGIHSTGKADSTSEASSRTWIVQAPQGAVLTFDQAVDEKLMKPGRLEQAFITGKVTIRGTESQAGAADQIELTTQNVQLTEQRVWTPHEVHFRMGHHFGSGRDLTIFMSPPPSNEIKRLPATIPSRVQSIELVHLDKLQLSTPVERTVAAPSGQPTQQITHVPISIASQGHLLVEMLRGVAQISNGVKISRPRLDDTGLTDHLQCDELALYFDRSLLMDSAAKATEVGLERVVARGAPAVAFTSQPMGSLEQAVYSLQATKFEMMLDGSQQFRAEGAGRLRGQIDDGSEREVEVSWQGSAAWENGAKGPLVTIQQQARCFVDQLGQLAAERIQLQLAHTTPSDSTNAPTANGTFPRGLQPVQLAAQGQVRVDARQLQARVRRLSVAIRQPVQAASSRELSAEEPSSRGQTSQSARQAGQPPARRFIVTGGEMELTVVQEEARTQVDDVVIQDQVRGVEVIGNNEGQGAEISGDRFELHNLASGAATGALSGQPVQVRVRRIDLRGPLIRWDQGSNQLWVDGAGSATLPLPPDLAAQLPGQAAVGFISWRHRLDFDGSNLHADGGVELRGPTQLIRCATLDVQLSKRLALDSMESAELGNRDMELTTIVADGGVSLENRTVDERRASAIDTGNMRSIRIDVRTSEIEGVGPGWIKTVRRGTPPGINLKPAAQPDGEDQLSFLRVAFQRRIIGNLRGRRMQFEDRIQAVYGPVADWDQEISPDPRRLRNDQVAMRCDRLQVLQMDRRGAIATSLEIQALGNTIVEGANFMARAHRLSYDQGKDQLILEGDGRTDAQLHREEPGKSRQEMSARKIQYQPQRNKVDIEGANSIELRG